LRRHNECSGGCHDHLHDLNHVVAHLRRQTRLRHLRHQPSSSEVVDGRKRKITNIRIEPIVDVARKPECGRCFDRFALTILHVIQPPFSLLPKRRTVINLFNFVEVLLGIRSACGNDFLPLLEAFRFRECAGA